MECMPLGFNPDNFLLFFHVLICHYKEYVFEIYIKNQCCDLQCAVENTLILVFIIPTPTYVVGKTQLGA